MGSLDFSPRFSRAAGSSILFAPVQAVLALFAPAQAAANCNDAHPRQAPQYRHGVRSCAIDRAPWRQGTAQPPACTNATTVASSRLKVLREFEPGIGAAFAGRMVMSGRMADVCAELERLTTSETPAHLG